MVQFLLKGATLIAAGYGVKCYLEKEENREKVEKKFTQILEWLKKFSEDRSIAEPAASEEKSVRSSKTNREKLKYVIDSVR